MDPITIALTLAKFAPSLIKWISGSDKAASVAQKAVDIAQTVTGKPTPEAAISALEADPNLALQYHKAILDQAAAFNQLIGQNAADINRTMQAEAASNHWPTYSWRPAIGFSVAYVLTMVATIIVIAYGGVILAKRDPTVLSYIPAMIGAVAALLGAGAMPVLGIASYFRGKMQADPTIPTDNRG